MDSKIIILIMINNKYFQVNVIDELIKVGFISKYMSIRKRHWKYAGKGHLGANKQLISRHLDEYTTN